MRLFDYLFYKTYSLFGKAREINEDGSVTSAGLSGVVAALITGHIVLSVIAIANLLHVVWFRLNRLQAAILCLLIIGFIARQVLVKERDERAMLRFRNESKPRAVIGALSVMLFYAGAWLLFWES